MRQLLLFIVLFVCALPVGFAAPLHRAIRHGDFDQVVRLIDDEGVDFYEKEDGVLPLELAKSLGFLKIHAFLENRTIQAHLASKLPSSFVGRSGVLFKQGAIIKANSVCADQPYIKVRYESSVFLTHSVWVYVVSTSDPKRQRTLFEVIGDSEPHLNFEPVGRGQRDCGEPFYFNVHLGHDGLMSIWTQTRISGRNSEYLHSAREFERSVFDFGAEHVVGISSYWPATQNLSTNLNAFTHALLRGVAPALAVFETHTGKQALRLGFSEVEFSNDAKKQLQKSPKGPFEDLSLTFRLPKK